MWCYSVILFSFIYVQNPVLFFDDFKDPLLQKWNTSDDGVQVLAGNLRMGKNAEHAWLSVAAPSSENWTNYTLKLRFRMIDWEERSGFYFKVRRHKGRFNIITTQTFVINPNEQEILAYTQRPEKMEDDPPIQRGNVKQHFSKRQWYLMEINTVNNKFALALDGQQLMSYIDLDTPPGNVSLFVFRLASEVEIDYIRLEIPSQSVSIQEKLTTTWGRIKNPWGQ